MAAYCEMEHCHWLRWHCAATNQDIAGWLQIPSASSELGAVLHFIFHKRLVNEIRDCFVHGRALLEKQKSIQKQYNYFNNITKVDVIKVILTGLFFRHGYLFLLFTF